jgi:hypothetical protein
MLTKLITQTCIILLLSSCSTRLSDYFSSVEETGERNDALIKSFEVEENVLEKFKENKEVKQTNQKEKKKAIVSTHKSTPPRKKTKIKTKKRVVKKKQKVNKKKISKVVKPKSFEYPVDFPEIYKTLDINTAKYWNDVKPTLFEGEEAYLDINYMGVSTGKIALITKPVTTIGDEEVYHFHARVKTSTFYSYLYELDDKVDTYVSTKDFSPVKFSLIQRESGQNIDDLQLFDKDKLQLYTFYKRETKKKTKKSKSVKSIPRRYQDPLSIVFFLRGLPMEKGRTFAIPIMNKGKVLILNATIDGVETIKTQIGKKEAYKVTASTKYSGDTIKSGDMEFWFSSDERRIFLKFKAKIKIGAISGEIEKYTY